MDKSREVIKNFFAKDENENHSSEEACLLNEDQPPIKQKNQKHDVDYTLKILKENSLKQIQMSDSEESSSSLEELPDFNPAAVRTNFGQASVGNLQTMMQMEHQTQDDMLDDMIGSLDKLGIMGKDINKELVLQTDLVRDIQEDMDDTHNFILTLDKKVEKLIEQSGYSPCKLIVILSGILLILVVWLINSW